MSYYVYFIESTHGSTYIGATTDLNRRIRQHNKEIKGGAVATSIKVNNGEIWKYICYIENCPSWNAALQCEWRWKQLSRQIQKQIPQQRPRDRRLEALKQLLNLDRPTTKAELFESWKIPVNVVYMSNL